MTERCNQCTPKCRRCGKYCIDEVYDNERKFCMICCDILTLSEMIKNLDEKVDKHIGDNP